MHKMNLVGAIGSHHHWDHVGGLLPRELQAMVYGPFGVPKGASARLQGLAEMRWEHGCILYAHANDIDQCMRMCTLRRDELTPLHHRQRLPIGEAGELEVLHTPGHTMGSICLCVHSKKVGGEEGRLTAVLSGDTLFPRSCGRLDCDDSSVGEMFDSLQKLRELDDELPVYPGHSYGGLVTTIGREKEGGMLRPFTREMWHRMQG
jgi:glyoxylase-like metal-dependent hydrolase (beta-lactamase superfamily II)